MGAHYCAICRHTSFNGKSHIFSKTHQSKLRVVLLKFFEKVKEARRTLKTPVVETFDVTQHMDKFWCYCCQLEVERNITDGNMTVIWGGLLEHMAKPDHRKNTHKFWWENNADPKLRDRVIFTEEEIEKFKTEVRRVLENFEEKEDHFVKQQTEKIRVQEMKRQEMLQSFSERETEADLSNTPNGSATKPKGVGRTPRREMFTRVPSLPGFRMIHKKEHLLLQHKLRSVRLFKDSSNRRNLKSQRNSHQTESVPTLITAQTQTPTGFHLSGVYGTVAGAGSPGINSDKKKARKERGRRVAPRDQRSSTQQLLKCETTITLKVEWLLNVSLLCVFMHSFFHLLFPMTVFFKDNVGIRFVYIIN